MGTQQSTLNLQDPIKDILHPQKGTLYKGNLLLRNLTFQTDDQLNRFINYLQSKQELLREPIYLKVKGFEKTEGTIYCSKFTKVRILMEFSCIELQSELRNRRIQNMPFERQHLVRNVLALIEAMAQFQRLGIFYDRLSTRSLLYDGNIRIMDPFIFDLPPQHSQVYNAPELNAQPSYNHLTWSLGVVILEMCTLQPQEQIYCGSIYNRSYTQLTIGNIEEPLIKYILTLIFNESRPDFINLHNMSASFTYPQPKQVEPTIQLYKVPCLGQGSLQERINRIKEIYYNHPQKVQQQIIAPNSTNTPDTGSTISSETFKDYFKKQNYQVDLASDPFIKERASDTNTIFSVPYNTEYIHETFEDGSLYEGYKKNKKRHGQGSLYYADGSFYIGEWENDKMNGYGCLYYPSGGLAYQGCWLNDCFNGKGTLFNETPEQCDQINYMDFNTMGDSWVKYTGYFDRDQKNGQGIIEFINGELFEGHFKDNLIDGDGVFSDRTQTIRGRWHNNIYIMNS